MSASSVARMTAWRTSSRIELTPVSRSDAAPGDHRDLHHHRTVGAHRRGLEVLELQTQHATDALLDGPQGRGRDRAVHRGRRGRAVGLAGPALAVEAEGHLGLDPEVGRDQLHPLDEQPRARGGRARGVGRAARDAAASTTRAVAGASSRRSAWLGLRCDVQVVGRLAGVLRGDAWRSARPGVGLRPPAGLVGERRDGAQPDGRGLVDHRHVVGVDGEPEVLAQDAVHGRGDGDLVGAGHQRQVEGARSADAPVRGDRGVRDPVDGAQRSDDVPGSPGTPLGHGESVTGGTLGRSA